MPSVTYDEPGEGRRATPGGGRGTAAVFLALFFLLVTSFPDAVRAEGITGNLDLGYSDFDSRSKDAAGNVIRSDGNNFTQIYNLAFSRMLYPYLRLSANGLFEKAESTSTSNAVETRSTLTRIQPYVDLTLRSPLYTAGGRYVKREDTAASSNGPSVTNVNETNSAILGWRPDGLPRIEMRADRTKTYDLERTSRDSVRDFAGLTMTYEPSDTLALGYRPSYTKITDRLNALETRRLVHVGRVDYYDRFYQDRASFGTSYNIVQSELQTSASGTGLVDSELVLFAGLSSIDDTPVDDALAPNAALIDDTLTTSAGINIGLVPIGGDTRERNLGLDFSLEQEVNRLLVWVDRDLPPAIAGSFSWDVYTSPDNLVWNFHTTVLPAVFGPFANAFELVFAPVTTRYIKVVVRPLSPAVTGATGVSDIFVTELQAFARTSAEQARGAKSTTNHVYNFDGKVLLLEDIPGLYYHVSYFYTKTDPSSRERWTLSNGLVMSHRFSTVFSGSASVAREDDSEPTDHGVAYVASTSLTAVPLRTLRHSITYSGRSAERTGGRSDTNSVFLNNYAELYRGINIMLSGGKSFHDGETGEKTDSTTWSAQTSLLPHRSVNLSYYISSTRAEQTRGSGPATATFIDREDVSVSYTPLRTLYLVATLSTISNQERNTRSSNYALNWSPFPDGTLLCSFAYNESQTSEKNAITRTTTPSLRWNVNRSMYLVASYQAADSESEDGSSDAKTFSTHLVAFY